LRKNIHYSLRKYFEASVAVMKNFLETKNINCVGVFLEECYQRLPQSPTPDV
jgi:hypothetical protein